MSKKNAIESHQRRDVSATSHYKRLLVALAGLVVLFIVARNLLVPPSFGRDGHYRATAVEEIVATETQFVGSFSCGECHSARVEQYAASPHAKVGCETCHGPARGHLTAVDADRVKLEVKRTIDACLLCHEAIAGRPESQPQIDLAAHAEENEFDPASDACLDCHSVEE
jgi:hypothetical protein